MTGGKILGSERDRDISLDEEHGGLGSLSGRAVEGLRLFKRGGLSYHEIAKTVRRSVSTVYKYTKLVAPEVFYEPGTSYEAKLARILGTSLPQAGPSASSIIKQRPETQSHPPNDSSRAQASPYDAKSDGGTFSSLVKENPPRLEETPRLKEAREEAEFWRRKLQAQLTKNEAVRNGADPDTGPGDFPYSPRDHVMKDRDIHRRQSSETDSFFRDMLDILKIKQMRKILEGDKEESPPVHVPLFIPIVPDSRPKMGSKDLLQIFIQVNDAKQQAQRQSQAEIRSVATALEKIAVEGRIREKEAEERRKAARERFRSFTQSYSQKETLNGIHAQTLDFLKQQNKESSSRMDPREFLKAIVEFKRTGRFESERAGESLTPTPIEKDKPGDEKQSVEARDNVLSESELK